eukprot:621174-Prymnesium_polylepis.1
MVRRWSGARFVKGESSHHRENEHVVRRRSRDGQEMVKGVASKTQKASAHINSVSAPPTNPKKET